MITEDYCDFETAKLLKEKGFNEKVISFYPPGNIQRPTLQMTTKWLREVHNINIEIYVIKKYDKKICEYTYTIMDLNFPGSDDGIDCCNKYKTYEKAAEAAIKYCLENLI